MWKNKSNNEGKTKSEDLWTSYKDLHSLVNYHLCEEGQNVNVGEFESVLRKYKQNFYTLLENPPRNAKSRQELKKGMEDGITIREIGHQVLSKDLYQETITLSDMYDLNEFVALDLLCTAQVQMPYHYGVPRGLVAILLYYDGRKCLITSLRLLVQARKGVSWDMNVKPDLINFITVYTNQLMEGGLFKRIFELLRTLDLNKEIEKLQENLALGDQKHRRQVIDMFNEIKECLAEIVFLWSSQTGLNKEVTVDLINCLRQKTIEEDANGTMDNVSFFLIMSLLSTMDLSILHIREDSEECVQNLPIISDKEYIRMLNLELSPEKSKWENEGMQAVALFGLAVTISCVQFLPDGLNIQNGLDKDVYVYAQAMQMKVFDFLQFKVLTNEKVYKDEIIVRRFHYLFTDFIIQMFAKVKELRIEADETARVMQIYLNEGIDPPTTLPRHFEQFMLLIAKFYSKDPLNLQYSLEYWCSTESTTLDSFGQQSSSRSVNLFKFVRLAGDLVPSTLFVSFLSMLSSFSTSSQGARNCFNLLKQASSGFGSTVTWDHFFISFNQYYNNLRQETAVVTDPFRRGIQQKGITPHEIEGLQAVLKIIKTVAEHDDFARLALCEHPGWAPLTVLLGLVSCSVPIPFKANLLLTLCALSKSPETAAQMWNNLEASQILVTIPTTSTYQSRGIQTELDEIESRMEEYPLTRSILKLLDVLTDFGIPRTLGAGPRKPGFDPYLTFIVNSVFLKFNTRSYQNAQERWLIGSMCLKLLEKFLINYEPQSSDFPNSTKPNEFNSPPGFHLMVQLNTKSEFLNLILYILEEGHKLFKDSISIQKYASECTLKCLNILERALALQNVFSKLMSDSSNPMVLSNLNKLLLIINPRSGQPDYCLYISKYLGYKYSLPHHVLSAAKILRYITSWPALHTQYFNILLTNDKESKAIRNSFVECLDSVSTSQGIDLAMKIKEVILKILKQCLPYATPNLTHFLLGFNLKQDLSLTIFQQPGVLNFPRTCLHSIFVILQSVVSPDLYITQPPQLLESTYQMLCLLCANYKISEPVLRFLRQSQNFFEKHLYHCLERSNDGVSQLNQLSWLLKTIAIELKVMSNRNQISYLQQLTGLLMGSSKQEIISGYLPFISRNGSQISHEISSGSQSNFKFSHEKLLIRLLNKFELCVEEVTSPKWSNFNMDVLDALLSSCETSSNPKLIDIKKLHHTLVDEIGTIHGNTNVGQRQTIMQEIEKVLQYAVNINNMRNTGYAIVRFINSWKQVVEVFSIYMPYQVVSAMDQQLLNIIMLENICRKISKHNILPDVAVSLSGTVLILMENTRRCYVKQKQNQIFNKDKASFQEFLQFCKPLFKDVLNYLVEWIMASDSRSQNLRVNLYTALVIFLELFNRNEPENIQVDSSFYVGRLDNSKLSLSQDLLSVSIATDVVPLFGEKLIDMICQDCVDGYPVGKMLAISTYNLLMNMSQNINWIVYMESKGYLGHIIQSIISSDKDLNLVLQPVPQNLNSLYVYQSRMTLLSQIATTRVGAELLLEKRILPCFNSMTVFNSHPEILKQSQVAPETLEDFIPPVENRYLQIFIPTLRLCNSIITSMSSENASAVAQIINYIFSHLDIVEFILRSGSPSLSKNFLDELSCLTSVISRIADANMSFMLQSKETIHDNKAHLGRLQKLMLNLLPKFLLSENVVKDLIEDPYQNDTSSPHKTSDRLILAFKILSNLVTYSRSIISAKDVSHSTFIVIFQPTMAGVFSNFGNSQMNFNDNSPSLGVVVQHLINSVNYYHSEKGTVDYLQRKLNEIPDMSNNDMKEFLKISSQVYDTNHLRESTIQIATSRLNKKKKEFDHCKFIIDNLLYILWSHIDYYMLKTIPQVKQGDTTNLSSTFNLESTLSSALEVTWKVSTDDISNLKQGLVSVFNDSFSRQLMETTQGGSEVSQRFVEILLRKIKRLIQFVPVK